MTERSSGSSLLSSGSETYFAKRTGGKVPISRDSIERGGASELGVDLCRVTNRKPGSESQQAFLLCGLVQRSEERRWVLSGDINYDKTIKSRRYERARFGPLPWL